MNHHLEHEVRNHLKQYISGDITLEEFDDWFGQVAWNVYQIDDTSAAALVADIEHLLSEFTAGYWTEDELLQEFRRLLLAPSL